jgi:DNA-binding transcriptional MerR regulator
MLHTQAHGTVSAPPAPQAPTTVKTDQAFRTIGEVADLLGVPQHVLRFWETKFSQIRPLKRGGGRRYYRPEDIALLGAIQGLLHDRGYTIKGVQKILREGGRPALLAATGHDAPAPAAPARAAANTSLPAPEPCAPERAPADGLSVAQRTALAAVLADLKALRDMLAAAA